MHTPDDAWLPRKDVAEMLGGLKSAAPGLLRRACSEGSGLVEFSGRELELRDAQGGDEGRGVWSRKPGSPGVSEGAHAELNCSACLKTPGRRERAQQAAKLDLDRWRCQLCSRCPATARSGGCARPSLGRNRRQSRPGFAAELLGCAC